MTERTIKAGDFIEMDFTGRVKETGEVFDTTLKEVAEREKINNKKEYAPLIFKIGNSEIIKGIEEFLIGKTLGSYHVELTPDRAFGYRSAKLLKPMSKTLFKKHNIDAYPGLIVGLDGTLATIVSVSGNRVLVDFNHPLAGKEVAYDLVIRRFVDDKKEQIYVVVGKITGKKAEIKEEEGKFVVDFSKLDDNTKKIVQMVKEEIKEEVKNKVGVDVELKV